MTEITVDKKLLQDVFSKVAMVVENRSISPISSTVKMHIGDSGDLLFTAKGSEMFVQSGIAQDEYTVSGDGDVVCIPAALFSQLLSKLPRRFDDTIKLNINPGWGGDYELMVTLPEDDKSKYKVAALDGESFFDFPEANESMIVLQSSELSEIIDKVPFVAAGEQCYMSLLSVYFFSDNGSLFTAATDAIRLVELKVDTEQDVNDDIDFMCYARGISNLKKVFNLDSDASPIALSCGDSYVKFSQDKTSALIRIIEGKFPEYRGRVIPEKYAAEFEINSAEWLEYIKPASLLTDVRLNMSFSPDGVKIMAESEQASSEDVITDIKWLYGSPINRVILSADFLNEQLPKFNGDTVRVSLSGEDAPIMISTDKYMQFMACISING